MELVGCVLIDKSRKIYLLHRYNPVLQWEIPGGKILKYETLEDAAHREAKEELGIEVKVIKCLGKCEFIEDNTKVTFTLFLSKTISDDPYVIETETFDDIKAFSWQEITKIESLLSKGAQKLVELHNINLVSF